MKSINIKSCSHCSNYEALLAVAQWMLDNRSGYKRERYVFTDIDKEFNVIETLRDDELNSCNGDFVVTRVKHD